MSDYVLFQMWGPFRQSLIAGHLFYVEQAGKRLLTQFEDIEAEADKAAEEWLEKSRDRFDPDRHDPGDFYEAANDAGIEFYGLLSDMREQTTLGVVAGMFGVGGGFLLTPLLSIIFDIPMPIAAVNNENVVEIFFLYP